MNAFKNVDEQIGKPVVRSFGQDDWRSFSNTRKRKRGAAVEESPSSKTNSPASAISQKKKKETSHEEVDRSEEALCLCTFIASQEWDGKRPGYVFTTRERSWLLP